MSYTYPFLGYDTGTTRDKEVEILVLGSFVR